MGADAAGLLARTLAWLTRGQVSEVRTAFSIERTETDYFEAIEGKTASLMASSCRMGALTARIEEKETAALTEFGDDILDVVATENQLGKPAGQDLAEGIYNLPTIFALRDANLGDELRNLLGASLNDDDRERARKLVIATDGITQTIASAQRYLAQAHQALEGVRSEPLRRGFGSLIELLLEELPNY